MAANVLLAVPSHWAATTASGLATADIWLTFWTRLIDNCGNNSVQACSSYRDGPWISSHRVWMSEDVPLSNHPMTTMTADSTDGRCKFLCSSSPMSRPSQRPSDHVLSHHPDYLFCFIGYNHFQDGFEYCMLNGFSHPFLQSMFAYTVDELYIRSVSPQRILKWLGSLINFYIDFLKFLRFGLIFGYKCARVLDTHGTQRHTVILLHRQETVSGLI